MTETWLVAMNSPFAKGHARRVQSFCAHAYCDSDKYLMLETDPMDFLFGVETGRRNV